jgi:DNA-binding transcriptional LysR family regulator
LIDKLTFLVALDREKHFGRAATSCGVTQPTLSAGLKQLETTLGVLLVHRTGRFGGFTPEGERVLAWAKRIVSDAHAMQDEVRARRRGLSGHLRLAAVPTALPAIARLTTPLRQAHSQVTFSVRSCPAAEVLAAVESQQADAGITYIGREGPILQGLGRVRHLPLFEERYRLLISSKSPLAARRQVDWADIAALPLSLLTPDMQNRRIIDQRILHAGITPAPVLESNSIIVLVTHVQTGHWATIVPAIMAESLGPSDAIRSIPIREEEPCPIIGLIYPQRDPLLPLTAAVLAEARAVFAPHPAL